ncbi:MAG: PQQ-dependent dehydrogenase, methanol/ethanol family, partial [Parahaliea sp.]
EATPIVVDGVIYVSSSWSMVYAMNASTGELLWKYDPKVPREWAVNLCCDAVNRGVAVWEGRVYVGTLDGRLVALDATNGAVVWEVQTTPKDRPYSITGAPRIVKNRVIIGNGGAELGVRGFVSAYDAATGEQVWRFYTVPGDPSEKFESKALEMAAKTWKGGEWWKVGGGGTVWDSMAYESELDLLYIGVGNGAPWSRQIRSPGGGDNLFLSSIVAVRPDTGEYVWHYQTTPGDSWDYTATQHMILADLEIAGKPRKVIMQAPKNGFFYVIDRSNGEFISAEKYTAVTWASHVDQRTGRPVENPGFRYQDKAAVVYPHPIGGHNWQPMSYSPATGLVYIPAQEIPLAYAHQADFEYGSSNWNTGIDFAAASLPDDRAARDAVLPLIKGYVSAWDPVQQKELWRVQHPNIWNGGLLSTAGNLLFQGDAEGAFSAYNAASGAKLWSADAQTGIGAAPITYAVDGEQYVAVVAGWGGAFALASGEVAKRSGGSRNRSRLLVYKLGGQHQLPDSRLAPQVLPDPPPLTADAETLDKGKRLYMNHCHFCHGDRVISASEISDLRYMHPGKHQIFNEIVLDGLFKNAGMVGFRDVLSASDASAIQAYIIKRAHETVEENLSRE